jgi:hypothetical protein
MSNGGKPKFDGSHSTVGARSLIQNDPLRTIIPHRFQRCLGLAPFPRNVLWLLERNTKRPRRTVGALDHFFAGFVGLRTSFFGRGFADGLAFLVWYLIIFNSLAFTSLSAFDRRTSVSSSPALSVRRRGPCHLVTCGGDCQMGAEHPSS